MNKSKRLAMASVFTALIVVILYLSSFFPMLSLSMVAIAGVLPAVLVSEFGIGTAAMAYVASSVLALILVPDRMNSMLFVLLFGHYPIIKELSERVKQKWFTWCIKLLSANVLFVVVWILFKNMFASQISEYSGMLAFAWLGYNVIFVMYDICLKKLVLFYKIRIGNRMR